MPTPHTHNHKAFVWITDYLEKKEAVSMTDRQTESKSRYSCPFVLSTNSGFFQTQLWASLCNQRGRVSGSPLLLLHPSLQWEGS